MQVTSKLNYLRIAPRKMRLLADLIRGKKIREAKALLDFSLKKGASFLKKLLDSAVANAKNNFALEESTLYVSKITVDEGPKLKRWRARARGRAAPIQKKISHITLVLEGEKGRPEREALGVAPLEVPARAEKKGEEARRVKPRGAKKISKPRKEIASKVKGKGLIKIFRRKSF